MNVAVFASGRGTNFAAIIRAVKKGRLKVNLALLVCDNPSAGAIGRAKRAGIPVALIQKEKFSSKEAFEQEIIRRLETHQVELIVLAGFMRLLSPAFVSRYQNKILNIHPALLPAFKGTQGIKDAFEYGVKVTGVTVHFVDSQMDHGPVILQAAVKIEEGQTLKDLEAKIHKAEHRLYPEAIRLCAQGKARLEGRRVIFPTTPSGSK
ncbi:MAG TPA: phosphoribosylglycinamide formyltransferase [Patescibacteria group bacterium]|nr:phosphoribosylglycinamide formyltransferase [Patescibacteria group bacterium]